MTDVQEYFNNVDQKEKCKLLAKNYEQSMAWEKEQVSVFSADIVADKEVLARQIFSPIHVDRDTKELTTLAFDDMFNKGLSTNRLKFISISELNTKGEEKAEKDRERKPDREYMGFVKTNVIDIRSATDGKRWFTVYDTALESDISHADVCCIYQPQKEGKARMKALKSRQRSLLQKVFSKIIKL